MVRAAIIHLPTAGQRQAIRRQLGTLRSNLVKRITQERYAHHFNQFIDYLQTTIGVLPASAPEYDLYLSEFLEVLWDSGEPKTNGTYTVAAVQYFLPQLRKQLPRSWRLKAVWDKLELPSQAVPLTIDSLWGIMGWFAYKSHWHIAFGCALAFNGLLRTGELLNLRVCDCTWTDQGFILTLQNTKGAQRRLLQDESVLITDPLTMTLIVKLTKGRSPGDLLVPVSPQRFRTLWNKMRKDLGLQNDRFIPYSLRRGGATWYFNETGSFSRTMLRGRWQHLKTCKLYISQAQLALSHFSLPSRSQSLLTLYAATLRPHLHLWASQGCVELKSS